VEPASLTCPSYGRLDQVQKVSAVVSAGASESNYAGTALSRSFDSEGRPLTTTSYSSVQGASQTLLSQRLSPPPRPSALPAFGFWSLILVITAICGLFMSLIGLALTRGSAEAAFWVIVCLAGIVLPIREAKRVTQAREEQAARELPAWEAALHRWQQLYYCHRCDGVFVPGTGARLILAENVRDFCTAAEPDA
jgi:hypothetical protein